jgi:hypothetical protein
MSGVAMVTGERSIGQAIARRVNAGFDVSTATVNVSS